MNTFGKVPKTLLAACAKRADAVDEVGKDDDGYWVWLKTGWVCPDMECGTIHEYTVADAIAMLKTIKEVGK